MRHSLKNICNLKLDFKIILIFWYWQTRFSAYSSFFFHMFKWMWSLHCLENTGIKGFAHNQTSVSPWRGVLIFLSSGCRNYWWRWHSITVTPRPCLRWVKQARPSPFHDDNSKQKALSVFEQKFLTKLCIEYMFYLVAVLWNSSFWESCTQILEELKNKI